MYRCDVRSCCASLLCGVVVLFWQCAFAQAKALSSYQQDRVTVSAGQSLRSHDHLLFFFISYSQPSKFFRLPGRRVFELGSFQGAGSCCRRYNLFLLGLSQEVQIVRIGGTFLSTQVGLFIRSKKTDRIGSKFNFGEKLALGHDFPRFSLEAYVRHFSNGSVTPKNSGQTLYGFSVGYKF